MAESLKYFRGSILVTVLGIGAGFWVGWLENGTWTGALTATWICAVLAVLEVSLSFDNAVVNATVLARMNEVWRRRFLTWGILVAVFGVRLVLPLAIVGVMAWISPWQALHLAITQPDTYAQIMHSLHAPVSGFGGTFLIMVALRYFFDPEKEAHWLHPVEKPLTLLGRVRAVEIIVIIAFLYLIARLLEHDSAAMAQKFFFAGIAGLFTFLVVDGVSSWLEEEGQHPVGETTAALAAESLNRASIGLFLYLEVLDASFSFDGVIGAFAITHNLFIICIGLGIGAMFVRSLTVLMVDRGTLAKFVFLEHGAFYAIGALGAVMFFDTITPIPEVVTAALGAGFIAFSFLASIRHARAQASNG